MGGGYTLYSVLTNWVILLDYIPGDVKHEMGFLQFLSTSEISKYFCHICCSFIFLERRYRDSEITEKIIKCMDKAEDFEGDRISEHVQAKILYDGRMNWAPVLLWTLHKKTFHGWTFHKLDILKIKTFHEKVEPIKLWKSKTALQQSYVYLMWYKVYE